MIRKPKINPKNLYETFIYIPEGADHLKFLRKDVKFVIDFLECFVSWYCFLVHNRESANLPLIDKYKNIEANKEDDLFYHIRFCWNDKAKPLPKNCFFTRKCNWDSMQDIAGINRSIIWNEYSTPAWEFLGLQCKMIVTFLEIHKNSCDINLLERNLAQFFHYFSNMTGFKFDVVKPIYVHYLI